MRRWPKVNASRRTPSAAPRQRTRLREIRLCVRLQQPHVPVLVDHEIHPCAPAGRERRRSHCATPLEASATDHSPPPARTKQLEGVLERYEAELRGDRLEALPEDRAHPLLDAPHPRSRLRRRGDDAVGGRARGAATQGLAAIAGRATQSRSDSGR